MNQRQHNYATKYSIKDTKIMSKHIAELKEQGILYNVKVIENGWILTVYWGYRMETEKIINDLLTACRNSQGAYKTLEIYGLDKSLAGYNRCFKFLNDTIARTANYLLDKKIVEV